MKRIYIFKIVVFLTIIILPIININLKPDQASDIDNKKLTELSEVFSGDFTINAEAFIEDRIGFRTSMINAYTRGMDFLFDYMVHPSYQYGKDGYIFSILSRENIDYEYQEVYSDYILKLQNYCKDFVIGIRLHLTRLAVILEPVNVQLCAFYLFDAIF